MVGRFIPVVFVCCVLAFTSCASRGGSTTYKFEPKEFHSLALERDGSSLSKQVTYLSPDISNTALVEGVWLNLPGNISIDTYNIGSFKWRDAKIPVCLAYRFANKNYLRMDNEHTVFLKDVESDHIVSARINLYWLDGVYSQLAVASSPRKRNSLQDGEYARGSFVYSITYFVELPRYSAEYEVWVKIADIESDHKRVKIDLKENGRLVTRPND